MPRSLTPSSPLRVIKLYGFFFYNLTCFFKMYFYYSPYSPKHNPRGSGISDMPVR